MKSRAATRGQPVMALVFVLGGWIAIRAMMWEAVAESPHNFAGFSSVAGAREGAGGAVRAPASALVRAGQSLNAGPVVVQTGADDQTPEFQPPLNANGHQAPAARTPVWQVAPAPATPGEGRGPMGARPQVQTNAAHHLMWMAAVSHMPLPVAALLPRRPAAPAPFYPVGRDPSARTRQWSADAWLLLRGGSQAALSGTAAPASYGASQAGAVLRYRLAPASDHRPAAYLRATSALGNVREREAAVGLSARPLPRVPVVVATELRLSDQRGGAQARPALLAVTELAPANLPGGIRAEAYGQIGYVGGRNATAFADGQLRAERTVARLGNSDIRAGLGAWGGAQKGAARLDIGPTASLGLSVGGPAAARVAVDWRVRVAGDASPSSGPALTLSAGF